jgi:hypothetical protein
MGAAPTPSRLAGLIEQIGTDAALQGEISVNPAFMDIEWILELTLDARIYCEFSPGSVSLNLPNYPIWLV